MSKNKVVFNLNKYPEIEDVNDFLKWIIRNYLRQPGLTRTEYYADRYYLVFNCCYDDEKNILEFRINLEDLTDSDKPLSEDLKREVRELLRGTGYIK